jgi:hypothetical protein
MKKRMSNAEQELIIEENKVYLKNNTDLPIQFNSSTSLYFLNTLKPSSYPKEWNKKDTLWIRPFYDSKEGYIFGPIDRLPIIYEFFIFYLIKWKGDNANLFQKNELDNLEKESTLYSKQRETPLDTISEKISYLQNYEITDDIKKATLNYLNPDERISFVYKPTIPLYRNFIYLAVGIIVILIGLFFFNPFLGEFDFLSFISFIFIMTLVPLFCCIQGVCSLSSKLLMRKSLYIFTNRKLIYKYGQKYCLITYGNINSASYQKRRLTHKYQDIILNLKLPVENNPYLNKAIAYLACIPYNSNILKEIEKLKDE